MSAPHLPSDLSRGVVCPECGCRRLLSERPQHFPDATVRPRRCAHCGHRVITSEQIDRPGGGRIACERCSHPRLLSVKGRHRIDRFIRKRVCPKCQAVYRTVERVISARPPQPAKPGPFRTFVPFSPTSSARP